MARPIREARRLPARRAGAARRRGGLRGPLRPPPPGAAVLLPAHARQRRGRRGRAAADLPARAQGAGRRPAAGHRAAVAVRDRPQPLQDDARRAARGVRAGRTTSSPRSTGSPRASRRAPTCASSWPTSAACPRSSARRSCSSSSAACPRPRSAGAIGVPAGKVKALVFQARTELMAERDARSTPCETIREELAVARGGALRRGPLRRHLRNCAPCEAYRVAVAEQRAGLASILPVNPALGLKATVLGAAAAGGGAAAGGVAMCRWPTKLAVIAALLGGGAGAGVAVERSDAPPAGKPVASDHRRHADADVHAVARPSAAATVTPPPEQAATQKKQVAAQGARQARPRHREAQARGADAGRRPGARPGLHAGLDRPRRPRPPRRVTGVHQPKKPRAARRRSAPCTARCRRRCRDRRRPSSRCPARSPSPSRSRPRRRRQAEAEAPARQKPPVTGSERPSGAAARRLP